MTGPMFLFDFWCVLGPGTPAWRSQRSRPAQRGAVPAGCNRPCYVKHAEKSTREQLQAQVVPTGNAIARCGTKEG